MSTGWMPPFETVNVPPARSSGVERAVARARVASSAIRALISSSESRSAPGDDRRDEPVVGLDRDGDVDLRQQLDLRVSVTRALSTGCSRSAAATSFTTIAVTPIRGCAPAVVQAGAQLDERLDVELEHRGQLGRRSAGSRPSASRSSCAARAAGSSRATVSRPARRPAGDGLAARLGPRGDVAVDDAAARARSRRSRAASSSVKPSSFSSARARGETSGAPARRPAPAPRRGRRLRRDGAGRLRDGRAAAVADVAEERVAVLRRARRPLRPRRARRTPRASPRSAPTVVPIGTALPARRRAGGRPAGALGLDLGGRLLGLELEHDPPGATSLPLADEPLASRTSSV